MFKKIVPITLEKHKDLKVLPINSFDFAKNVHIASIMAHEFSRIAPIYPIVFIEDPQTDQFKPVAMLGLEPGENLFVNDESKWEASYIPAIIRRYPFALAKIDETGDKYTVCIDEDSQFVNTKEGESLFNEDGTPTEVIENVKKYLTQLHQMDHFTSEFSKFLKEHNLFNQLNMKVRIGTEIKNISGAYVVNEERLNNLSNDIFISMRGSKYIPVIYSHLSSLSQIERLLGFKDKKYTVTEKIEERFEEKTEEKTNKKK